MFKNATDAYVWLGGTGIEGDEVADKKSHGGPEKAIFAYPFKHYESWRKEPELTTIGTGSMGENLSLAEADEFTVCIGDVYQFGEAVIQVSQPRQPCWKPARRFQLIDFALRIQKSGRTGWYFRVLQEGKISSEMDLELLKRPYPEWSIAACNEVMHVYKDDLRKADDLASCEFLAENWKRRLRKRLAGKESGIESRVYGPNKE